MSDVLTVDRELLKQYLPDNPLIKNNINGALYRPNADISLLFTRVIDFSSREIYGESPSTLWRGFFPVSFNFPHPQSSHIQLKLEAQAYVEYYSQMLPAIEDKILLALSKDQSTLTVTSVPSSGTPSNFIDYTREKLSISSPTPLTITNLYQALKIMLEEKIDYYQAVDDSLSFDTPPVSYTNPSLPNPNIKIGRTHTRVHPYKLDKSDLGLLISASPEFVTTHGVTTLNVATPSFYDRSYGHVWKNIRHKLFLRYHDYQPLYITNGYRTQLTYNRFAGINRSIFYDIELYPFELYPDVLHFPAQFAQIGNSANKRSQGLFFIGMSEESFSATTNFLSLFYPTFQNRKVSGIGYTIPPQFNEGGVFNTPLKIQTQSKINTFTLASPANETIISSKGRMNVVPSIVQPFNPNESRWIEHSYEERDVWANASRYKAAGPPDPDFNGVRSLTIEDEVADKKCWVRGTEIDSVSVDLTYDERTTPAAGSGIIPAGYILTLKLTDQTLSSTYPALHWYGTDDLSKPNQIGAVLHYEPYFRVGSDIVPVSETSYNIEEIFFYIYLEYIKEPFTDDGATSNDLINNSTSYGIRGPRNGLTRFFYQRGAKLPDEETIRLSEKLPMVPETLYNIPTDSLWGYSIGTIGIRNNFEDVDEGNPINYYIESYEILRPSLVIPFANSRTPFTTSPK